MLGARESIELTDIPASWSCRDYLGATSDFDGPHVALQGILPLPRPRWPDLAQASAVVAEQLAGSLREGEGEALKRAAAAAQAVPPSSDPWSAWLLALGRVHDVPAWRHEVEYRADGWARLRIACPYSKVIERWARFGFELLQLGRTVLDEGRAEARVARWQEQVANLAAGLPEPDLMRLHAALTSEGLPWQWNGADATLVGQGSRGKVVRGFSGDPADLVRRLAELEPCIPVYAVTGSVGKTTTLRLLTQLLAGTGLRLGIQASDGAWAAGRQLAKGDQIDGKAARTILRRPDVDAAVLEFGRRGLMDRGFPFDKVDIAVLLNVQAVHLGIAGVDTIEAMADVKSIVVKHARAAVLNRQDAQCLRIGESLEPGACVWFGVDTAPDELRELSRACRGTVSVSRNAEGAPLALKIWRGGSCDVRLPLEGVAPHHGMLGEKTLEELAAAVAAAWFGPIRIEGWKTLLQQLRLDNVNHRFRASLHGGGNLLFVLDKADSEAPLRALQPTLEALCDRHKVTRRICVFLRSPGEASDLHRRSCAFLHPLMDEFVAFDRIEVYPEPWALPEYAPGSVPLLLKEELERLNRLSGQAKPVHVEQSWETTETYLRTRLAQLDEVTLVLINFPTTSAPALNERMVDFVNDMTAARSRSPVG